MRDDIISFRISNSNLYGRQVSAVNADRSTAHCPGHHLSIFNACILSTKFSFFLLLQKDGLSSFLLWGYGVDGWESIQEPADASDRCVMDCKRFATAASTAERKVTLTEREKVKTKHKNGRCSNIKNMGVGVGVFFFLLD